MGSVDYKIIYKCPVKCLLQLLKNRDIRIFLSSVKKLFALHADMSLDKCV